MADPVDLIARDVLKKVFPDPRSIRAFDQIQQQALGTPTSLAGVQLLVYTPDPLVPAALLVTANAGMSFDISTPGTIKFNINVPGALGYMPAHPGANSDITSLSGLTTALSIVQGGTGATTAANARTNINAAISGANSDITSLSGLTTALSIVQGGTGLNTAPPTFSAYRNGSTQNLPNAAFTQVQFNTTSWNTGICYDSVTNFRFTPNVAGKYLLNSSVSVTIGTASTPPMIASVFKNGVEYRRCSTLQYAVGVGTIVSFEANALVDANGTTDYFDIRLFQGSGGAATINQNLELSWFQGAYQTP